MLNSLEVRNYRNLKGLKINSLGNVNLITGKNNTGKSTILEAIALYSSNGNPNVLFELLSERGEISKQVSSNENLIESNLNSLKSLFTERIIGFENENTITIGEQEETIFGQGISNEKSISFRFIRYFDELQQDIQEGITSRKRIILDSTNESHIPIFKYGFETRIGNVSNIISLDDERIFRYSFRNGFSSKSFQFIRTRNIDKEINGKLFDNIALTEREKFVIDALKIIEISTERIAFIGENSRERTAVIKLTNLTNILPLRSMGDGINRILTIILALVNCDNGFMLIDEFENGLHHSVQEQLWKVIFSLSEKLNIQVFATTHSEDCIMGFENVLNNVNNTLFGKLIRLDNINGKISQVEYSAEELKIATDQNIETR